MRKTINREDKSNSKHYHTLKSIRTKVFVGFILFILTIGVSWIIVRYTIDEMIITIEQLDAPSYKVKLMDQLFQKVAQLEQTQRAKAIENPDLSHDELLADTKELCAILDTLSALVMDNTDQLMRIRAMREMLDYRTAYSSNI